MTVSTNTDDLLKSLDGLSAAVANVQPAQPLTNSQVALAASPTSDPTKRVALLDGMTPGQIQLMSDSAIAKLAAISNELSLEFFEREEIIADLMRAIVVGEHMLILGPPGTAKSYLIRAFIDRIKDAKYFSWLLNRTSDPSEILGPYSVIGMQRDEFKRKSDAKLPDCHIAFVDEIFKANEPVLNILLPLLNERIFFNNGKAENVPLISMICASNETPDDEEELGALYDRILIRTYVDYIQDPSNRFKMHQTYTQKRNGTFNPPSKTIVTLQELEAVRLTSSAVTIPNGVFKAFNELLSDLAKTHQIKVSDRRQNACLKILQANAIIKGRKVASVDDIRTLVSVLWERKEDIDKIIALMVKYVAPEDQVLLTYKNQLIEIKNSVNNVDAKDAALRSNETDVQREQRLATIKTQNSINSASTLNALSKKVANSIRDLGKQGVDTTALETFLSVDIKDFQNVLAQSYGTL